MRFPWLRVGVFSVTLCLAGLMLNGFAEPEDSKPEEHPLSAEDRAAAQQRREQRIKDLTIKIEATPTQVNLFSARGDERFFSGNFKEAVADYQEMVRLDAELETSHWRRGIAQFYAGQFKEAAHQFEIYHSFDMVDRENGIWRYLSQHKAYGQEKAREGLLKYEKDDREPFPAVYQLFAGKLKAEEILDQIRTAEISPEQREMRLFYAELYIGLNEDVEGRPAEARKHLRAAVANTWGPKAGFGPHYMWEVGRVHYERLLAAPKEEPVSNQP